MIRQFTKYMNYYNCIVKSLSTIQLSLALALEGGTLEAYVKSIILLINQKSRESQRIPLLDKYSLCSIDISILMANATLKDPIFFSILCQTLLAVKYYSGEFALHRMTFSEHYLYSHRGILLDIQRGREVFSILKTKEMKMATQVQVLFLSALDGEHLGFVLSVFLWLQKHLFYRKSGRLLKGYVHSFQKLYFNPLNYKRKSINSQIKYNQTSSYVLQSFLKGVRIAIYPSIHPHR